MADLSSITPQQPAEGGRRLGDSGSHPAVVDR